MRNIRVTGMDITDVDKLTMIQAITDGEVCYGKYNKFAERALAKYEEQDYAFLVNSGSSANLLAFMAFTSPLMHPKWRLSPGDEIITVATAFPTTITPIVLAGCVPVFVDINEWYNIDAEMLEKAYSSKTKGVFLAHTLGIPYDIDAVQAFCHKYGLFLISDCCDALGSVYKDVKVTNRKYADVVTNSSYAAHHICSGEGGAVLTSDPLIAKIIQSLRDWGRGCLCDPGTDNKCGRRFEGQFGELPEGYDHKYVYSHLGFNLKMTNPQAALLYSQLKRIDEYTDKRIRNFDTLHEELHPWAFPYKLYDGVCTDFEAYPEEGTLPSWFGYPITLPKHIDRKKMMMDLNSKGIGTRLLFSGNILRQPAWRPEYAHRIVGNLDMSNYITEHMFWIGCWHGLTEEDILYEREVVKQVIMNAL
jgi:CDP-6-deoxy-D-xylo-4-hexulose-3-dehydrase